MCTLRSATLSFLLMLPAAAGCSSDGSGPDESVFTTLVVTPTASTLFSVSPNNSVTLLVVSKDQNGAVMVGPSSFTSANPAVASVSGTGIVTAVGFGSTQITTSVTIGGVSKSSTTHGDSPGCTRRRNRARAAIRFHSRHGGCAVWRVGDLGHRNRTPRGRFRHTRRAHRYP